jgi:hypothetical protein
VEIAAAAPGLSRALPEGGRLLQRTAENGKSQVLDLLRGLLPPAPYPRCA